MSDIVNEVTEIEEETHPINVSFKPRLRTDGEFIFCQITQNENEINLTQAQAVSLAKIINSKI